MDASEYLARVGSAVSRAFGQLLQSKHLYQSVWCFGAPKAATPVTNGTPGTAVPVTNGTPGKVVSPEPQTKANYLQQIIQGPWQIENPAIVERPSLSTMARVVRFRPPDVKVFCRRCDRIEAFNLITAYDSIDRRYGEAAPERVETVQVFVLGLLCQSCKQVPEIFLVRREGARLTLAGRAPIEHVSVPPEIPKTAKRFYRGAMIAHQTGETLAGNFMLRTLIEQWARTSTRRDDYADQVLDAYVETLPEDFRATLSGSARDLQGPECRHPRSHGIGGRVREGARGNHQALRSAKGLRPLDREGVPVTWIEAGQVALIVIGGLGGGARVSE